MAKGKDKPLVGGISDKLAPLALVLGCLLTTAAFILAFTVASPVIGAKVNGVELIGDQMIGNQLLFSQKIFYFHMPVAVASMVCLGGTGFFGLRFLMTRDATYDMKAKLATEVALVFVLATMATGEMWERFEWGVWWTWEPRLTTYFILMLLIIGYFILRAAVEDPERRAVYAAIFGIITFIDVPITFVITRLVPSGVHPVIFRTDSGLSPDMLIPMLCALFGFMFIAFGLYRFRFRTEVLASRIEALKNQLDA